MSENEASNLTWTERLLVGGAFLDAIHDGGIRA